MAIHLLDLFRLVDVVMSVASFLLVPPTLTRYYRTRMFWWLYAGLLILLGANMYGRLIYLGSPDLHFGTIAAFVSNVCLLIFVWLARRIDHCAQDHVEEVWAARDEVD